MRKLARGFDYSFITKEGSTHGSKQHLAAWNLTMISAALHWLCVLIHSKVGEVDSIACVEK